MRKVKYPKTKEQLETQSVVIAGREYKSQSEFFDFLTFRSVNVQKPLCFV